MPASENHISLETASHISPLPKSRHSAHSLWLRSWTLYMLPQLRCVSHWEAWPLWSLSRARRSRCVR